MSRNRGFSIVPLKQVLHCKKAGTFIAVIRNPETDGIMFEVPLWTGEESEAVDLTIEFEQRAL